MQLFCVAPQKILILSFKKIIIYINILKDDNLLKNIYKF